ncbi:MAG TPA: hypothetical protein VK601_29755, partial [Kofleriaceae bacterium]|nr:hypothetical protein [Kofleriaceae bacterium]
MKPADHHGALRSAPARAVRRTSLLLGAGVIGAMSGAELLYRAFDGPLLAVRLVWCALLAATGLALPRAGPRLYGALLTVITVASCWLFATTVWLGGGVASPDFQYMVLLPLGLLVALQDEVLACATSVLATVAAVAVLSWLGDAPLSVTADSLASDVGVGVLAVFGALSFRRVRLAELATQRAR